MNHPFVLVPLVLAPFAAGASDLPATWAPHCAAPMWLPRGLDGDSGDDGLDLWRRTSTLRIGASALAMAESPASAPDAADSLATSVDDEHGEGGAAPVVTGPGDQAHIAGTRVSVAIVATDPEGDALTYGALNLPAGLSVDPRTGVIAGTVAAGVGTYTVTATASDAVSTGTRLFTWSVTSDLVVRDTFTGSYGTPIASRRIDAAPAGAAWTSAGSNSTPVLQNGWIGLAAPGGGHQPWSVDTGISDAIVSAHYWSSSSRPLGGIVVRATDTSNYLLAYVDGSYLTLYRVQGGSFVPVRAVSAGITYDTAYRLEVRASGDRIRVYVDGVLRLEEVQGFQRGATRHGLSWNDSDPTARFDDFEVRMMSGPPVVTGPADQHHVKGDQVAVPIAAIDPEGAALTYSATGLPAGLGVNLSTGFITGTIAAPPGTYAGAVSASDGIYRSTRALTWTVRAVPPAGVVVSDTFAGPNGTPLAAHPPEVAPPGATWSPPSGTSSTTVLRDGWALAVAGGGHQPWTIDGGLSDVTVSATYRSSASRPLGGLAIRATDARNYLLACVDGTSIALYRVQDATFVPIAIAEAGIAPDVPSRLQVRADGDRIHVSVNGVLRLDALEPFQRSATRHGVSWNDADPTAAFDAFEVLVSGWAPVITGPGNQTHTLGMSPAVLVPIAASDPDGSTLTYGASGLPSGLSVNASTGVISGTLAAAVGVYRVTVGASDGVFSSTHAFTWSVLATPPAPPPAARVFDTFSSNGAIGALSAHHPAVAPAGAAWSVIEGLQPSVDGGVVVPPGSGHHVIAAIESGTTDGVVVVEFRSVSATPVAGLVLRAAGAADLLVLRYAGHRSGGRVELVRRVNEAFRVLTSVSVGPIDSGTHRIEARLAGRSLTAVWDGASLFEYGVEETTGRHGLYWDVNQDRTIAYDTFFVTTESFTPLPAGTRCEAELSRWFIPAEAGNTTVTLDVRMPAPCAWSARTLAGERFAWANGTFPRTGSHPVQFGLYNNTDLYPRVAHASVAGQLVTIVQAGLAYAECQYTLSAGDLDFNAEGGSALVSVTPHYPSCTWGVDSTRPWIVVGDGSLRSGRGSFAVSVPHHDGAGTRNGYLHVGPVEVAVEQAAENCPIGVSPRSFQVGTDGQSVASYVEAPPGCTWEAVSLHPQFLTVTENPNGHGPMPIRIAVANNPPEGSARIGAVEVRRGGWPSQVITVSQLGTGACAQYAVPGVDCWDTFVVDVQIDRQVVEADGVPVPAQMPIRYEWARTLTGSGWTTALRLVSMPGLEMTMPTGETAILPGGSGFVVRHDGDGLAPRIFDASGTEWAIPSDAALDALGLARPEDVGLTAPVGPPPVAQPAEDPVPRWVESFILTPKTLDAQRVALGERAGTVDGLNQYFVWRGADLHEVLLDPASGVTRHVSIARDGVMTMRAAFDYVPWSDGAMAVRAVRAETRIPGTNGNEHRVVTTLEYSNIRFERRR